MKVRCVKNRPYLPAFTLKVRSFESSELIQKKEGWSYCAISDNESSSVTLNKTGNESQKEKSIAILKI